MTGPQLPKTVVVLGATGHFGSRICRRLAGEPKVRLVVTSRQPARAASLVEAIRARGARVEVDAASLEQDSDDFAARLEGLRPFLVIHTAGPYQGQDYQVARACIRCGSHYVDLADGRSFVRGFGELDAQARRAGVLLVTGASTLPGLSSAVLDQLGADIGRIRRIEISIAPAHRSPRGRGTIAAVLSYCGRPFEVLENGRWVTRFGWQDLRLQAYPGLGRRLSAACDVPDLSLWPARMEGLRTVTFHAALEAWWEQLALWSMAWITRAGVVRGWSGLVPGFDRLSRMLRGLGGSEGGMRIGVAGHRDDGRRVAKVWVLTAGNDHGPEIPCSPALVLARKLVRDEINVRGAMPCLGLMSLSDFDDEVRDFDIGWKVLP